MVDSLGYESGHCPRLRSPTKAYSSLARDAASTNQTQDVAGLFGISASGSDWVRRVELDSPHGTACVERALEFNRSRSLALDQRDSHIGRLLAYEGSESSRNAADLYLGEILLRFVGKSSPHSR